VTDFVQQVVNGVVLGATFGLIALGYTMVYGIVQLINFAHGEVFMVGAFAGLYGFSHLPDALTRSAAVALPCVLLLAMGTSVLTAVALERLAYRPLRNAPRLAPLITAIGMSLFLQELVRLFYPHAKGPLSFPSIIPGGTFEAGGVTISWVKVFAVVVAVVLMIGLDAFVNRTRIGKAMRATAQDPDTARLMGINTDKVIVITFVLGGALAGVAGVVRGMQAGAIDFHMGFQAGIKAFSAAVLGGIGNIRGAVLGGFLIGMTETLSAQYLGTQWKDVWAFVVLILVLTLRPQGLLGARVAVRS
jgi:branched-chain amino acid transport system permease protein